MYYLIYDVYPNNMSKELERFVGAHVSCWIDTFDEVEADLVARNMITDQGWVICNICEKKIITGADYTDSTDGLEYYEQAKIDHEVFFFHTVEKQYIYKYDTTAKYTYNINIYDEFVKSIASKKEVWGLVSDDQWANGISSNGECFFPLWLSAKNANSWLIHWKNFVPSAISTSELIECFLQNIYEEDLLIAINSMPDSLMTHHPISFKKGIADLTGDISFLEGDK